MSDRTKIEWTRGDDGMPGATWNPVTGCTEVSPGCDRCYAKTLAERFRGTPGHYYERGFDVQLRAEKLGQPLRWTRPRRIFVNSMSDLFHVGVPDTYIADVFTIMLLAERHTFQLFTKRHGRMHALLRSEAFQEEVAFRHDILRDDYPGADFQWPLPNLHLIVSAEDQQRALLRIPVLLDTPAAIRGVSLEPLLGSIDLTHMDVEGRAPGMYQINALTGRNTDMGRPCPDVPALDWVVVGGESGRGARPMHPEWARSLQRQCEKAETPFVFKQWGEWTPLAPLVDGKYDFRRGVCMTDDGNIYQPGDLEYPDGPRRGEAQRADFPHHHPTSMYRVGKHRAGRELYHDGRLWDEHPVTRTSLSTNVGEERGVS
ncbi:phage Gp37/Gp68 family protein [Mycobacterium sp. NPDC049093]